MIRKLTLAVGFSAGYVLGAKAGKERYTQIESKARELLGQPAVQGLTSNVTSSASAAADKAKATVNEKVGAVGAKVGSSSSPGTPPAATPPASRPPVTPPLSTPPLSTTPASTLPVEDEVVVVDLGTTATKPVPGASPSRTTPDVL